MPAYTFQYSGVEGSSTEPGRPCRNGSGEYTDWRGGSGRGFCGVRESVAGNGGTSSPYAGYAGKYAGYTMGGGDIIGGGAIGIA